METDRWQKIKSIFDRVVETEPDARPGLIAELCGDDHRLRSEVEKLLRGHEQAGEFLDPPELQDDFARNVFDEQLGGERVGAYVILERIGSGGMGNVYLAERADEEFKQRVAIKLIRVEWTSSAVLQRFKNERQVLADLNHPNIANLLDGGTTDSGVPYLVMEHIEGQPIDEHCQQKFLSIAERLELFLKACSAVQYAHQNLVIHRDLKPGNILVTEDGQPKLLDFGIAKLLDSDSLSRTIELTQHAGRFLSLEYASPEQIRGDSMTTGSDVYSLGVLLYKILTGNRPYDFNTTSPTEIARVITEEDPTLPSEAVLREENGNGREAETRQPQKWSRQLKGDLDNIILMALRKEPERRYVSVEQFADDIRRYLKGLPVLAHKDSFGYRATKFVRRHRSGVAATIVIILLLIASIAAISWQATIATRERDRARIEAAKAEQVLSFLQETLSATDPARSGRDVTVAEVLDESAGRLEEDFANQPEIEAKIRTTIGLTYRSLGLFEESKPHLLAATQLYEKIGNAPLELAESARNLAVTLRKLGEFEEAKNQFERAIALYQEYGSDASMDFAETLNDYAVFLDEQGSYEKAEELLRSALVIERKLLGPRDIEVSIVLNNLGHIFFNQGMVDSAVAVYREAMEIAREQEVPTQTYIYLNNLGSALMNQGDYAGAEKYLRQSLTVQRQLYGEDHPTVGVSLQNLAANNFYQEDYVDAEALVRESVRHFSRTLSEDHPNTGNSLRWLARILLAQEAAAAAEHSALRAVQIHKSAFPSEHWTITYDELELGRSLLKQNKYNEAESLLLKTYEKLLQTPGDNNGAIKTSLQALVELYQIKGEVNQASHYRELLTSMDSASAK